MLASQNRTANLCVNSRNKIGEIDQECCGGKIETVDQFVCAKHKKATDRKCRHCSDFRLRVIHR